MLDTGANASKPVEDAGLSKAELRRRRILAKKGARMALVTGDQTLATADTADTAVIPPPGISTISTSRITRNTAPIPAEPTNMNMDMPLAPIPGSPFANASRRRSSTMLITSVPSSVRVVLVVLCGLLLPFIRSSSTTYPTLMSASSASSASALQVFLGTQALFIAPELLAWCNMGMLSTLLGVAKHLSSVWRDAALFLFALFVSLRLTSTQ